jgi:Ca2+/Na+ antiporter
MYTSIFYIIIALALFGLIASLIQNPIKFLQRGLLFGLVLLVLYLFYRMFSTSTTNRSHQDAYRRAAKRTVKKYNTNKSSSLKRTSNTNSKTKAGNKKPISSPLLKKKSKDTSHLTVIEGEKGKKKNRASL